MLQNNTDYLPTVCSLAVPAQLKFREYYLFFLSHFKNKIISLYMTEEATSVLAYGGSGM